MAGHGNNRYRPSISETFHGADYTPEEIEFMTALRREMNRRGIKFPTCRLVLEVARSLGYRKVVPPGDSGKAAKGERI